MLPTLFKIGPITIHSFGFMLAVGFLLVAWFAAREFNRRGFSSDDAWSITLAAMIGGVIGAKLYFAIDHWSETVKDPDGVLFSGAGLTYYGGLIGGATTIDQRRADLLELSGRHEHHQRVDCRRDALEVDLSAGCCRGSHHGEAGSDSAVGKRDARVRRNRGRRGHSGHDLERDSSVGAGKRLFSAAAEDERIAALQTNDDRTGSRVGDEQRVDLLLLERRRSGLLAGVDALRAAGREIQQRGSCETVIHDHVGLTKHLRSTQRHQPRVAGSRSDQIDGSGHGDSVPVRRDMRRSRSSAARPSRISSCASSRSNALLQRFARSAIFGSAEHFRVRFVEFAQFGLAWRCDIGHRRHREGDDVGDTLLVTIAIEGIDDRDVDIPCFNKPVCKVAADKSETDSLLGHVPLVWERAYLDVPSVPNRRTPFVSVQQPGGWHSQHGSHTGE
jgi:hypothetical protein